MASGSIFYTASSNPFGLLNANPQGSNYANDSGYSVDETLLLAKEIRRTIFDAAPVQFNALKLLFSKQFEQRNSDEHEFVEKTFERTPIEANGASSAVVAVPGSAVQQTITVTSGSLDYIGNDLVIAYPNNTKAIIRSFDKNALTITVESNTSVGLPAVADGDVFSIQAGIYADGMTTFNRYERLQTISRYNYIQFFLRAERWGRVERQKYINLGTTNYMDEGKKSVLRQLRTDLFVSFINGTRGEFRMSTGEVGKAMGGIFPSMVAAGATNSSTSLAGLKSAFEACSFASSYLAEGATRFVLGTDEMLYELSKAWKENLVRYTPDSTVGNLNLKALEIGTQTYVLVPTELFKDPASFPSAFASRLICIDMNALTPVVMKGIPAMDMGETPEMMIREGLKDFWSYAQLGLEFNNPLSSFWIDII